MNRAEAVARLQAIIAESADLRKRLSAARESGDPWTARWYADRLTKLDNERRALEWEIH